MDAVTGESWCQSGQGAGEAELCGHQELPSTKQVRSSLLHLLAWAPTLSSHQVSQPAVPNRVILVCLLGSGKQESAELCAVTA